MRIQADPGVDEEGDRERGSMAKPTSCLVDPSQGECPVCGMVDLLGRKWTLHLVWTLREAGPVRFNELERRAEGISPRVLSDRLDQLVDEEIVERTDHDETPPRVEYALTEKGHDLEGALEGFLAWARRWDGLSEEQDR